MWNTLRERARERFLAFADLPDEKLEHPPFRLELTGEVKWIVSPEQATRESPAGMGVQFVFKTPEEQARVAKEVTDLMRSSLGDRLADKLLARR